MALKTVHINNKYKIPLDGFYEFVSTPDLISIHVNIYENNTLIQTMNTPCNYAFYFIKDSVITFMGTVIVDENSDYQFPLNRIGGSSVNIEETQKQCSHDWVEYVGFTNRFTYCSKCDDKK